MSILLKNTTFIDYKTLEFIKTHIIVNEDINDSISFIKDLPDKNQLSNFKDIIECDNKIVTKSFACGHHHVYSALSRGMPAPAKSPQNFHEILQYIWWRLDKCLDEDTIEASAYATAIACAKNGVTFVIDHHASPNHIGNSLSIIANVFEKVGVSHLLCYEITDRDGMDKSNQGLEETEHYLSKNQGLVGLHASFTVSDDTVQKAVLLARNLNSGIHIHVAEDLYDQKHCMEIYNKRVVERLNDMGVLDFSKTILGHCLHLNENEREIIKNSKVYIVQNTESNLNNNVGYFNSEGLNENIMIGTDGMHSDMLRSAKAAFYLGQGFDKINYPSSYERFRKVHKYLDVNNFKGDGDNNLVVLDYNPPTEISQNNFLGHFIFGIESSNVKHVISSGKLIVRDKQLQCINEEEIMIKLRKSSKKLWSKMDIAK